MKCWTDATCDQPVTASWSVASWVKPWSASSNGADGPDRPPGTFTAYRLPSTWRMIVPEVGARVQVDPPAASTGRDTPAMRSHPTVVATNIAALRRRAVRACDDVPV